MGRSVARLGLTGKVMVLSLVPIVLLGLALTRTMQHRVASRALADATQRAVLLTRVGVRPHITPRDLEHGLSLSDRRALDEVLSKTVRADVARIKIWNPEGVVVYSDNRRLIGRHLAPSDELRSALAGRTASDVDTPTKAENVGERGLGRLLEVYTPLRFGSDGPPAGAFELYVPYEPVAAGIADDTRTIVVVLLLGLAGLWAMLLRIVSRASRTLRRQLEENRHQARHDGLTRLPNRNAFRVELEQTLKQRPPGGVGVVLLDLDRFKEINDTLGHQVGDRLLCQIGPRIQRVLRPTDVIARLGGDEFGVLLPGLGKHEPAAELVRRVLRALEEPFVEDGMSLQIGASAGVAVHPADGDEAEGLVRRADVALYHAKESRNGLEVYDPGHDLHSAKRLALLGDLRTSIAAGELVVYYQPKAELASGRVVAVEALTRWNHPTRGLIGPDEFIGLAEQSGLIHELTAFVLDRALADCAAFQEAGLDVGVAVNLSARNLLDVDLPVTIDRLMDRHPSARGKLELEITESDIMAETERAGAVLRQLTSMGISLAIDDFGTGYSSLAQLKLLRVQTVKIDKSFVMGMAADPSDAAIVRSTIDLAASLGLSVVAEGVETAQAWQQLHKLGCDYAQGYLLSRPIPAMELPGWMAEYEALTQSLEPPAV